MRIILCFLVCIFAERIGAQATDLFISEYIEGSAYNKALEIYNGTGYSVNLASYYLEQDNSGNDTFLIVFDLSGILPNDNVYVITRPSASQRLLSVADTLSGLITNFNGDDQIRLMRDSLEVDHMGIPGDINFGKDVTYIRKSYIHIPATGRQDPRDNGEWQKYDKDYFDNLGSHSYSAGFGDLKPRITYFEYAPKYPQADQNLTVYIRATDDSGRVNARLYLSLNDQDSVLHMQKQDTIFTKIIPSSFFTDGDRLGFYALVEDIAGQRDSTYKVNFFTGTSLINDVKNVDDNGVILYKDYHAQLEGILTTEITDFCDCVFVQDKSAAIKVRFNEPPSELKSGHLLSVRGAIRQNNGFSEIIVPDSMGYVDYGRAVPVMPNALSIEQLNRNAEPYESMLVTLQNVRIIDGQWPEEGHSADIVISDNNNNIFTMYIDRHSSIAGYKWPEMIIFNVSGIIIQADSTLPYDSNYKIMPMLFTDIDVISALKNSMYKMPDTFELYPALPNPFNAQTVIRFNLPAHMSNKNTELTIYNSLGQIVKKVFNKRIQQGNHHYWFNAGHLSTGSYFAVLKNGLFYRFSRLTLIK